MHARIALLGLLLTGCRGAPCDGMEAACINLRLDSTPPEATLDALKIHVHSSNLVLLNTEYELVPADEQRFTLPIRLALVIERAAWLTHLDLAVTGKFFGRADMTGGGSIDLAPGEHRDLDLVLEIPDINMVPPSKAKDASTDDDAGVPDGGSRCPAEMVDVASLAGFHYCVDATEVTTDAYARFLAGNPSPSLMPAACSINSTFDHPCKPGTALQPTSPVACVNWCQAAAYCASAAKHLCSGIGFGGRGDGSYGFSAFADATVSEWYNACSAGGTLPYPYGASYQTSACNGWDYAASMIGRTVGSIASCDGSVRGLFDMSGNVAEWENSCDGDNCRVRGGGYQGTETGLRCDANQTWMRFQGSATIGFRCCR